MPSMSSERSRVMMEEPHKTCTQKDDFRRVFKTLLTVRTSYWYPQATVNFIYIYIPTHAREHPAVYNVLNNA